MMCKISAFFVLKSREILQEEAKMLMTLDVNDTINYLKYQFWLYGTNEMKYNFTQAEFRVGSPSKPRLESKTAFFLLMSLDLSIRAVVMTNTLKVDCYSLF